MPLVFISVVSPGTLIAYEGEYFVRKKIYSRSTMKSAYVIGPWIYFRKMLFV